MSGNEQELSPTYTCRRFPQNAFCLSCVQEMYLAHQISCIQEMCLKCHLSFMPPNLVIGNVPEMSCVLAIGNVPERSCVLATGNLPEILPYTVPGNVKEMSKFPGVGNVHTMNRKCELSCTFHGISWPRKFRIFSSVCSIEWNIDFIYIYIYSANYLWVDFEKQTKCSLYWIQTSN